MSTINQVGVGLSGASGTGSFAGTTSPTFTTPTLGVASATSINKLTLTAPATGSTLTIVDGKTLTVDNTLTFSGTDSASVAFGAGGTVLYSGGPGGFTWTAASGTTQAAAVNVGYICTNASACTVTLPASAAVGSQVAMISEGVTGGILAANTGQTINILTKQPQAVAPLLLLISMK